MNTKDWINFFALCNEFLGKGSPSLYQSESWCSWTTFDRMQLDAGYWQAGLPNRNEYSEFGINDGGSWGQPFPYESIAHLIVPKEFMFSGVVNREFVQASKAQNIHGLSKALSQSSIPHVLSQYSLELRLIIGFS